MNNIDIEKYTYYLPEDRIATHPLRQRDQSNLLVYKSGTIQHSTFNHIPEFIPEGCVLFFNNTKVIPARILFKKETGAEIELFLLNPVTPQLVHDAMQSKGSTVWACTIGNLKRWTHGTSLSKTISNHVLTAILIDREKGIVKLSWSPDQMTFASILLDAGQTPLPPYIRRKPEDDDATRYQTVYSVADGAVAAPTAGLHFTEDILRKIAEKKIFTDYLTLHVSAGTFQPVKTKNAVDHTMHAEQVIITRKNVETLLMGKKVVAVGTTSLRTLESLYWFGARLLEDPTATFRIEQSEPYQNLNSPTTLDAIRAVARRMDDLGLEYLTGETSIFILPGYRFKICSGLITNFHQPGSTLMLLVAALVGDDWKRIYKEAMDNNYRFLSYGDSSLLWA